MSEFTFECIAHIENDYKEKFGIPRQSGLVDEVVSRIIFEKKYQNPDALRGLKNFSHLWLIWVFSEDFSTAKTDKKEFNPTVRPPRLGGNERMGVFATRSPNRPNPIGLSCVEIVSVDRDTPDGPVIYVSGADLMDGTPIIDIKPYIVYADSRPDAISGFATSAPEASLNVTGLENLPAGINKKAITQILSLDPRPAFHDDPSRVYGLSFGGKDIHFTVADGIVNIIP